jgi:hypothetical protein
MVSSGPLVYYGVGPPNGERLGWGLCGSNYVSRLFQYIHDMGRSHMRMEFGLVYTTANLRRFGVKDRGRNLRSFKEF